MATTPNFLWLEAILRHARAYLELRPESPLTAHYLESVKEALDVFQRTRHATDRTYLTWRNAFNRLTAVHKAIRLAYDAARKQCIEWGLKDYPERFVSYMEEERTQRAALDMIAFLEPVEPKEDWMEPAIQAMKDRIAEAQAGYREQEAELAVYKSRVRERKLGYDRGYELAREFFAAVKSDLDRDSEDYRRLSPYPLT